MEAQNITEYKAVRDEIATIKNCITTYVGFVLVGSATSFWGLASRASEKGPERLAWGVVAMLLAITSAFVLFLLSYKFTSHNRGVGYSKLLAHERFYTKDVKLSARPNNAQSGADAYRQVDFSCWEICIDMLRASDARAHGLCDLCDSLTSAGVSIKALKAKNIDLKETVERISGLKPPKDSSFQWYRLYRESKSSSEQKGSGKSSHEKSGSWKFPMYVTRIFLAIDIVFVAFAALFVFTAAMSQRASAPAMSDGLLGSIYILILTLFVGLVALWMKLWSKLARQLHGSETVEGFCWKFVPIRVSLLRELDPTIEYDLIGVSSDEAVRSQGPNKEGPLGDAAAGAAI